jgi:hypothetical protein
MTAQVEPRILDFGLNTIANEATHITLCQAEPTNVTMASLGNANCIGIGAAVFSAPSTHANGGRCVTSSTITDGTIVTTGTVAWWSIIDAVNDRLLAHQVLVNSGPETAGNHFTLSVLTVRLPAQ